jgi:hypothetical protein
MSCYVRHLEEALRERGIRMQPENRKAIDRAIHDHVGVGYKDCPVVWTRVKAALEEPAARESLLDAVAEALES